MTINNNINNYNKNIESLDFIEENNNNIPLSTNDEGMDDSFQNNISQYQIKS